MKGYSSVKDMVESEGINAYKAMLLEAKDECQKSESKADKKPKKKARKQSPLQKAYNQFFKTRQAQAVAEHNKNLKAGEKEAKGMRDLTEDERKSMFNGIHADWPKEKKGLLSESGTDSDEAMFSEAVKLFSESPDMLRVESACQNIVDSFDTVDDQRRAKALAYVEAAERILA